MQGGAFVLVGSRSATTCRRPSPQRGQVRRATPSGSSLLPLRGEVGGAGAGRVRARRAGPWRPKAAGKGANGPDGRIRGQALRVTRSPAS
jgi:hypothetical protein